MATNHSVEKWAAMEGGAEPSSALGNTPTPTSHSQSPQSQAWPPRAPPSSSPAATPIHFSTWFPFVSLPRGCWQGQRIAVLIILFSCSLPLSLHFSLPLLFSFPLSISLSLHLSSLSLSQT